MISPDKIELYKCLCEKSIDIDTELDFKMAEFMLNI